MRKSFVAATVITAVMVIMTGCGRSGPGTGATVAASSDSTPTASPATSTATLPTGAPGHSCGPPTVPAAGTSLTLTSADNGKTYCVGLGTGVLVYLKGTPDRRWTSIRASSSVLRPAASGHLALALGVTGASFLAARAGVAVISSTRPVCGSATTSPGVLTCDAIQAFRVIVMISS
ncbi:MAG TPA: hypothetical protein VGM12_19450 [Trebonia sp.]